MRFRVSRRVPFAFLVVAPCLAVLIGGCRGPAIAIQKATVSVVHPSRKDFHYGDSNAPVLQIDFTSSSVLMFEDGAYPHLRAEVSVSGEMPGILNRQFSGVIYLSGLMYMDGSVETNLHDRRVSDATGFLYSALMYLENLKHRSGGVNERPDYDLLTHDYTLECYVHIPHMSPSGGPRSNSFKVSSKEIQEAYRAFQAELMEVEPEAEAEPGSNPNLKLSDGAEPPAAP